MNHLRIIWFILINWKFHIFVIFFMRCDLIVICCRVLIYQYFQKAKLSQTSVNLKWNSVTNYNFLVKLWNSMFWLKILSRFLIRIPVMKSLGIQYITENKISFICENQSQREFSKEWIQRKVRRFSLNSHTYKNSYIVCDFPQTLLCL